MVHRIFRPDSVSVWKNLDILKRFSRYKGIIDNNRLARYLIAKTIPSEHKTTDSLESLEFLLNEKSKEFNEILTCSYNTHQVREIKSPNYLSLAEDLAYKYLEECIFCERQCKINRMIDEKGYCLISKNSYISSAFLHMGEEAPLIPSGTIFFQGCNFGCVFCQNYDISQAWKGRKNIDEIAQKVDSHSLALLAENLVDKGAVNINYVGGDPTPNIHTILGSLKYQRSNITQLWNSNFYLTNKSLSLIIDFIDFWLPDFKYGNNDCAKKYSGIDNYYDFITRNLKKIHDEGSGEIIIRHLVMPNHVDCCSKPILEYVAKEVPNSVINIMGQFRPEFNAYKYKEINRRPTTTEMNTVKNYADKLGILFEPVS